MKIGEAITKIDEIKPNGYTKTDKIKWLSTCDSLIKRHIIDTHTGNEDVSFEGYDDDTPLDTDLIAGEPYDDMYLAWLEAKIDYYNAEYTRYNNSIVRFNDSYAAFSMEYNRTHMPLGKTVNYF